MTTRFYYTYVLRSLHDGKLYIGSTGDLKKRLREHQRGGNTSTARRLPFELAFYEAFSTQLDAQRRERYFKTSKGKTTLRQMLKEYLRGAAE